MTLTAGNILPTFTFTDADGEPWRTDRHRDRNVALVLILHRHLH